MEVHHRVTTMLPIGTTLKIRSIHFRDWFTQRRTEKETKDGKEVWVENKYKIPRNVYVHCSAVDATGKMYGYYPVGRALADQIEINPEFDHPDAAKVLNEVRTKCAPWLHEEKEIWMKRQPVIQAICFYCNEVADRRSFRVWYYGDMFFDCGVTYIDHVEPADHGEGRGRRNVSSPDRVVQQKILTALQMEFRVWLEKGGWP